MKAIIRHNGRFIQEGLCLVDTSKDGECVILETDVTPAMKLDIKNGKGFVEVHIWGVLENMED